MHNSGTFMTRWGEYFTAKAYPQGINTMLFTFEVSMPDGSDNYEALEGITRTNECTAKQSWRDSVADRAAILAPCLALADQVNVPASARLPYAFSFRLQLKP